MINVSHINLSTYQHINYDLSFNYISYLKSIHKSQITIHDYQ